MNLISIDPGNELSAYSVIDENYVPVEFGKVENALLRSRLKELMLTGEVKDIWIEDIASYGMAVGRSVFDTCKAIGRLQEIIEECGCFLHFVYRKEYVTYLCGTPKANDSNVVRYLVDRFAPYTQNNGKGTKKNKGFFYGFKKDIWQSYAVGVYAKDLEARK